MAELYWAARVTLLSDRSQVPVFDRVFAQVFEGFVDPAEFRGQSHAPPPLVRELHPRAGPSSSSPSPSPDPHPSVSTSDAEGQGDPAGQSLIAALSPTERLRHKDFAAMTPDELAQVRCLADRMKVVAPPRSSRRRIRHSRGDELDIRATLRRARRSGGEPLVAVHRRRRLRPRRVVLICDISGSMEPYARAYIQLLATGVAAARAEAFVFATRLTRLTRLLRGVHPQVALHRAGRTAPDWSGGTRIGEAIKAFNDGYGRGGLARGAVVVLLSDGWETGDPSLLGTQMSRLARLAFRIVWVNPRKASERFEPLTGGMAAALPHVDAFVSGHSPAALEELLEVIGRADLVAG
jgi:uncharacterized protein with von Willebrand factor type A (vWA) domain